MPLFPLGHQLKSTYLNTKLIISRIFKQERFGARGLCDCTGCWLSKLPMIDDLRSLCFLGSLCLLPRCMLLLNLSLESSYIMVSM